MKEAENEKNKGSDETLTDATVNTSHITLDDAQSNALDNAPMNTSNNALDDALTMKQK